MRPTGFEPVTSCSGGLCPTPTCADTRRSATVHTEVRRAGGGLRRAGVLPGLLPQAARVLRANASDFAADEVFATHTGSITATPGAQPDLPAHRRRFLSTSGPPDANHRVPHTQPWPPCEFRTPQAPAGSALRAHETVDSSTVVVPRALGQPFSHCDGLFATHRSGSTSSDSLPVVQPRISSRDGLSAIVRKELSALSIRAARG